MKRDVHNHEERFKKWKEEALQIGEPNLSKKNSDLMISFVLDMEQGINIARGSKKGARSYPRLNAIRTRTALIMRRLEKRKIKDITKTKEQDVFSLFSDMRTGKIKSVNGTNYQSVADYVKMFKAFWNWHIKTSRKKGITVEDITLDLDTSRKENTFVWLTKEEVEKLLPYFEEDEQLVLLFIFDSLIRAPTELLSLKVKDISLRGEGVWVTIPAEVSKTGFSRTLNLLYSAEALRKYIERKELNSGDYLFSFSYPVFSEKIQKVAEQVFGNKASGGGEYFKKMTLYDLRHSGAIHLRIIAQKNGKISLDALRQRGGWTDFKIINYYTKFLGLSGEINKNDLLIEEDKSKLEKEMDQLRRENKRNVAMLNKLNSFMESQVNQGFTVKKTAGSSSHK